MAEVELSEDLENFLAENQYIDIIDKDTINIHANDEKHQVTIPDVIQYYRIETKSMSGMRSLGSISGDWRPIDELAGIVLEIFKEINPEGLKAKGGV